MKWVCIKVWFEKWVWFILPGKSFYSARSSWQESERKKCEKTEYFGCRISEREGIGTERETCLANNIALSLSLVSCCFFSLPLSFCFFLSLSASAWFRWEKEKEREKSEMAKEAVIYGWENNGCKLNLSRYYQGAPLHNFGVVVVLCLCHFFSFFYRKCYRHEGIHESHSLGGTHISVGSVFFEFLWLWSLVNGKEGDADSQECVAISKDQI